MADIQIEGLTQGTKGMRSEDRNNTTGEGGT
jgi:hypothetical protein